MSTFVLVVFFSYAGWATLLFLSQRVMMYPGRTLVPTASMLQSIPADVRRIQLPFSGGQVEALFIRAGSGTGSAPDDPAAALDDGAVRPAPAVIFAHGNGELIEYGIDEALDLAGLGLSVLLVEYPGYGRSDGRPTRATIAEVFTAAHDWLTTRDDVAADRIVGMGRSLGGGAITDLAGQRTLRALVLLSTFSSVADMVKHYLVPSALLFDDFDNVAVVRAFPGPVLLVHGTRDRVIGFAHSERLAAASPNARLLRLECGHNDCPPDSEAYMAELRAFLAHAGVL